MMHVYNEEEIIECSVEHLISEGLELVVLDNGSTDSTNTILRRYLGKGMLEVSILSSRYFELGTLLPALYSLAEKYRPDWLVLSDADMFLESPYKGLSLREAIEHEAAEGYNVIQFDHFEFWMTEKDQDSSERDVRRRLRYYSWVDDYQYRAWKHYPGTSLEKTGGHVPIFPSHVQMKVSPTKFILRHYKFHSLAHGMRQVFEERIPRYAPHEVRKGWHQVYYHFKKDPAYFIIDSEKLTRYENDGRWNGQRKFAGFRKRRFPSKEELLPSLQPQFYRRKPTTYLRILKRRFLDLFHV